MGIRHLSWCLAAALAACGGGSTTKPGEVKEPVAEKPAEPAGADEPAIEAKPDPEKPEGDDDDDDDEGGGISQGKFTWFELFTANPAKAAAFYKGLFGWDIAEQDMGGTKAHVISNQGQEMGLILDASKAPMPKGWMVYISVAEVDDSVLDAKANGGKVVNPAVDVKTVGVRFAVLADPSGATFGVARRAAGDPADRNDTGDWYWPQLMSTDPDDTYNFYSAVAGYTRNELTVGSASYVRLVGDELCRGFITKVEKGFRPAWIPLVIVADTAAASASARKLGGKVLKPTWDAADIGKIALLQDPGGNAFGVVTPPLQAQPPGPPDEGDDDEE